MRNAKVVCIIEDRVHNKVLIGKLRAEEISNFGGIDYVFPGGAVEEFESLDGAVIREVYEETGLEISSKDLVNIGSRIHPRSGKLIFYFVVSVFSGELNVNGELNDDLSELIWVDKQEVLRYMPSLFGNIKKYFKLS